MPPGLRNRPSHVMSFDFILCSNQPHGQLRTSLGLSAKGLSRRSRSSRNRSGLPPKAGLRANVRNGRQSQCPDRRARLGIRPSDFKFGDISIESVIRLRDLRRSPSTEHSTKHRKHTSRVKIDAGDCGRALDRRGDIERRVSISRPKTIFGTRCGTFWNAAITAY
jgi:hypothetical protein